VKDDNSADKELDFSSMSLAELEEFCRLEVRESRSLLMPIIDRLEGRSIRQVTVWCVSFIIPWVGIMRTADRRWVSSLLRRTADYVLEAHKN
jgi:hypothetical protein